MNSSFLPLVVALILIPLPLLADVQTATEQNKTVQTTVAVKAKPEAAWEHLLKIGTWWSFDHTWSGDAKNLTLNAAPGGGFDESLPGNGFVRHMQVIFARTWLSNFWDLRRIERQRQTKSRQHISLKVVNAFFSRTEDSRMATAFEACLLRDVDPQILFLNLERSCFPYSPDQRGNQTRQWSSTIPSQGKHPHSDPHRCR